MSSRHTGPELRDVNLELISIEVAPEALVLDGHAFEERRNEKR